MKPGFATLPGVVLLAVTALPAYGHRLDEYLQNTILSVDRHQLQAQMVLTPGLAVFPVLVGRIDTDGDGAISEAEQRAYAAHVLHDLSLGLDGFRLTPRVVSMRFPGIDEMKEGRGEIQIDFSAELPRGGRNRRLSLENHHESRISAYQVNCLVSRDPNVQIGAQNRNYSQSAYELVYTETDVRSGPLFFGFRTTGGELPGAFGLLLLSRLVFLWRRSRPLAAAGFQNRTDGNQAPAGSL